MPHSTTLIQTKSYISVFHVRFNQNPIANGYCNECIFRCLFCLHPGLNMGFQSHSHSLLSYHDQTSEAFSLPKYSCIHQIVLRSNFVNKTNQPYRPINNCDPFFNKRKDPRQGFYILKSQVTCRTTGAFNSTKTVNLPSL